VRVRDISTASRRLQRVVEGLLRPEAYPHPTARISVLQTHASYVLLTGEFAYKIKKPVDFGFLDYSSLARRRHFCHEEVRLNQRLSPEMYLGVVEIGESSGGIRIGPTEKVLEYAVKMIQLPEGRMMDQLLARGKVSAGMVKQLAEKLVGFHLHARTDDGVTRYGCDDILLFNARENFSQLALYLGRVLPAEQFEEVRAFSEDFIRCNGPLLAERVNRGRIREGHGDLRAQNICFDDGIRIFDCIEFNERFRMCDVASDIAFLVTDLDYAGGTDLSHYFVRAYVDESGDKECLGVIDYYKVYRACVRTKIECLKLDEPEIVHDDRIQADKVARGYCDLAMGYVRNSRYRVRPQPKTQST